MNTKKAQAAIELAIFGSIVIFVLGMIMRAAFANSYMQNQNFRAMRMAMLASYEGSKADQTQYAHPINGLARNSASILFVEDRLSPDVGKYGSMDRAPQMAQGSGTFSYALMNLLDANTISDPKNLPIMDVYINGQHFPLTTAASSWSEGIGPKACSQDSDCGSGGHCREYCSSDDDFCKHDKFCDGTGVHIGPTSPFLCMDAYEKNPTNCFWGSTPATSAWPKVNISSSGETNQMPVPYTLAPSSLNPPSYCNAPLTKQEWLYNQCLRNAREWVVPQGTCPGTCSLVFGPASSGYSYNPLQGTNCSNNDTISCAQNSDCPNHSQCLNGVCDGTCGTPYKLFYTQSVNGTPDFTVAPFNCSSQPCAKDQELTANLQQVDSMTGNSFSNTNGDMQFDYSRNGDYQAIEAPTALPLSQCTSNGQVATGTSCSGTCTTNPICMDQSPATCDYNKPPGSMCTCDSGSSLCYLPNPVPAGFDPCLPACWAQSNPGTSGSLVSGGTCPGPSSLYAQSCLRANMAWEWLATPGEVVTTQETVVTPVNNTPSGSGQTYTTTTINVSDDGKTYLGINTNNDQPALYDVDGRLKSVKIYTISGTSDNLYLGYEDMQGGDIDLTWDANSYNPNPLQPVTTITKPGLQPDVILYGFVDGTYLQIKEGKLYDPATGHLVSSVHKRYNVDLIQRRIQLSNNTGRFCTTSGTLAPQPSLANGLNLLLKGTNGTEPNPVEVCAGETSATDMCTSPNNIKLTCYDTASNVIYVRSRLADLSGRAWITDTGGKLGIK